WVVTSTATSPPSGGSSCDDTVTDMWALSCTTLSVSPVNANDSCSECPPDEHPASARLPISAAAMMLPPRTLFVSSIPASIGRRRHRPNPTLPGRASPTGKVVARRSEQTERQQQGAIEHGRLSTAEGAPETTKAGRIDRERDVERSLDQQ